MVWLRVGLAVLVAVTVLFSLRVVRRLDRTRGSWRAILGDRFVLGVPWGTIVVVAFVLGVYLFVQDGLSDFENPLTIPFRAWSYWYPLGMVTGPFSHANPDHLIGNLTGTLVLAPIAEYAWGHYPRGRDCAVTRDRVHGWGPVWLSDPRVRAFLVFPVVVVAIGLVTSIFAVGPIIGFSGVVFAFAGFAIVRFPITTIVAAIGIQTVLLTLYRAIRSPILVTGIRQPAPAPPSWATIAVQGHALGLFVGIVLGVLLVHRRNVRPDPVHLWVALVVFGFVQALWAIYWFGAGGTYVLFRGPGVAIALVLAAVVTVAITATDRSVTSRIFRREPSAADRRLPDRSTLERALELGSPEGGSSGSPNSSTPPVRRGRIRAMVTGAGRSRSLGVAGLDWGTSAFVAVVLVLVVISGPALVFNTFTVAGGESTEATVTVQDYAVTYDEDVENRLVSIVPVDAFGEESIVETSGVIVWSEDRHVWTDAIPEERLAFSGEESVELGGIGWRTSVTAERAGWDVAGNETAYQVWITPDGGERSLAYASEPVRPDVVIGGNTFTVVPAGGGFSIEISDGETAETVDVPPAGESVDANGVTIDREDSRLYATSDGSRAVIASQEEYR